MYDATHDDISTIPANPLMVAGYDTGTIDVQWTAADWAPFRNVVEVHIDQAFNGPVYSANVMDVEPFCYSVSDVLNWTSHCTAPRPTVYCDRNDLPAVESVWSGDIWLAAPGWSDATALAYMQANPHVVAVQNLNAGPYDRSLVGDRYWPRDAPPPPPPPPPPQEVEMLHGDLAPGAQDDIAFPVDTFDAVCLYSNTSGGSQVLITVFLNAGGGQSTWTQPCGGPTTIQFPHQHAVGVSLRNTGTNSLGWTLVSD